MATVLSTVESNEAQEHDPSRTYSVVLPESLTAQLDRMARRNLTTRAGIIRQLLVFALRVHPEAIGD